MSKRRSFFQFQLAWREPAISLASSLNGYMYSNCTSLNVAVFILMANHFVPTITLQLLGVKIIPCGVASLFDIQLKMVALIYFIVSEINILIKFR